MIDLSGKHIFISGGSRGIGAASARMAASCGAEVSLTYNSSPDAANALVSEIEKTGGKAFAVQCEVTDRDSVNAAVAAAVENVGFSVIQLAD